MDKNDYFRPKAMELSRGSSKSAADRLPKAIELYRGSSSKLKLRFPKEPENIRGSSESRFPNAGDNILKFT